jgi:hypothetical protein
MSKVEFTIYDRSEATVREFKQFGIQLPNERIVWADIEGNAQQKVNLMNVTGQVIIADPATHGYNFPTAVTAFRDKQNRLGLPVSEDLILVSRKITVIQHAGFDVVEQAGSDE